MWCSSIDEQREDFFDNGTGYVSKQTNKYHSTQSTVHTVPPVKMCARERHCKHGDAAAVAAAGSCKRTSKDPEQASALETRLAYLHPH